MDIVFFFGFALILALYFLSQFLAKGIGEMKSVFTQIGLFILKKNPPGLVDLFNDEDGSGSKTWMNFGMLWFFFAGILGFLVGWHTYDPSALNSLSSVGWSYDDGSALLEFTVNALNTALLLGLIGGGMVVVSRNANGRLASESNASMVAVLISVLLITRLILPGLMGIFDIDTSSTGVVILLLSLETLAIAALLIPVLINLLVTIGQSNGSSLMTGSWFVIMAVTVKIFGLMFIFFGELADSTQTVWLGERIANGWAILALLIGMGYYVVPKVAEAPIWSPSLRTASMVLLFVTPSVFFMTSSDSSNFLSNVGAILLTLSMLPLFAASVNILMTATHGFDKVMNHPGALAVLLAFFLLPFFVVGSYFTAMDVFVGAGEMTSLAAVIDVGAMFTIGGLVLVGTVYTTYPLASGKKLPSSSTAHLSVYMIFVGGLASTIAYTIGEFSTMTVNALALEDVTADVGGYYLTGSVLFYILPIGALFATLLMIRTGISRSAQDVMAQEADIKSYTLVSGAKTTIRDLIGRGVGIDTVLVLAQDGDAEGGTTLISVGATLHDDEITEIPDKEVDHLLVLLANHLVDEKKSVFDLFRQSDKDASGSIDDQELRGIFSGLGQDLTDAQTTALVRRFDIDGDGSINLPELDIQIALTNAAYNVSSSSEEEE
jgi:hypothetical protein